MTAGEARQIAAAVRDIIVNDRVDEGVAAICRLARIEVPTRPERRYAIDTRVAPHVAKVPGCGCGLCQDGPPRSRAQPKRKRIEDPDAIEAYLAAHELCENKCGRLATVVHHLKPVSRGGDDVPDNFAALCGGNFERDRVTRRTPEPDNCHTGNNGFHPLGGKRWFKMFNHRWESDFMVKVMRALRI